jgi:hypothetical protein
MKSTLLITCSGWVILAMVATPLTVQAQFIFTTNNGAITITAYTGLGGVVAIPSTTNGFSVTSIGSDAFLDHFNLTSVTIPNSVTNIGASAFRGCTGLTNVTIGNSVTSIGESAFSGCSSLASVAIPNSLTRLGDETFTRCTNLTSVTIGNSVTSIWHYAFGECYSLANITIPNNVISITDGAFAQCTNLDGVYFQGNAPGTDMSVFNGDTNATVYYLPGTTGWGAMFDGVPAMLWNPQAQTSDGNFGVQTNGFGFNITGSSNLVIVVETCINLANPSWTPVSTNTLNTFIGTNGSSYFSDSQWTNYPSRFYRLRSP